MTYEKQIRLLETEAILLAEHNDPEGMIRAINDMFLVTDKFLGNTNEYLIDKEG